MSSMTQLHEPGARPGRQGDQVERETLHRARCLLDHADGDITTANGRPYRIIAIEEYANPLTFSQTFPNPLCAA
jgi:hypothetical protein